MDNWFDLHPIKWACFPFRFAPDRLLTDLGRIEECEWTAHYNQSDYSGDWSGLALRSPGGSARQIFSSPSCTDFHDTELMHRCSYFREVVETFRCPIKAVRLLRLRAGSRILEHTDADLGFEDGELRIHVPVQTNRDVEFVVAGTRLIMNEGDCWYVDFSLPHWVHNRGISDRIHLVIDAQVNPWARRLIETFAANPLSQYEASVEPSGFDQFRELVLEDEGLQSRLLTTSGHDAFLALTVELGRERGCEFTVDDVESAVRAGRRAWSRRERTSI